MCHVRIVPWNIHPTTYLICYPVGSFYRMGSLHFCCVTKCYPNLMFILWSLFPLKWFVTKWCNRLWWHNLYRFTYTVYGFMWCIYIQSMDLCGLIYVHGLLILCVVYLCAEQNILFISLRDKEVVGKCVHSLKMMDIDGKEHTFCFCYIHLCNGYVL